MLDVTSFSEYLETSINRHKTSENNFDQIKTLFLLNKFTEIIEIPETNQFFVVSKKKIKITQNGYGIKESKS